MCGLGIGVETYYHRARLTKRSWIKLFSIVLYVLMGWMAAWPPLMRDFALALKQVRRMGWLNRWLNG